MWFAVGCGGEVSVAGADPTDVRAFGSGAGGPNDSPSPPGSSTPPGAPGDPAPRTPSDKIGPAPETRAARLTHVQWENSVRDLLGLGGNMEVAALLRADPVQAGFLFDNDALSMSVDEALWSGYQQAAAKVAELVTSDTKKLTALVPQGLADDGARAEQFVRQLGLRAHRHPLSDAEAAEYLALFHKAAAFYPELPAFSAGVRVVIEAMLQAPSFVYRIETSERALDGVIALDSYEIAARLSYALWNTMPDAELLSAAAADRLRDPGEVTLQAQRMLQDARAQATVAHFHDQLFEVDRFAGIKPSTTLLKDAPANLGALAAEENRRFVQDLVFAQHGSYADMLTSTTTFVNAELAKLYGLPGSFGAQFVKASLDPAERAGLFTQIGFLALHATSVNPDPIHRGVFLARRITCTEIAAPPANIPPLPEPQGRTNRETIEAHTQQPGSVCSSCHTKSINPLGFPFENFDAIGRRRSTDNGHPVNTSSEAWTGSARVPVKDGLELTRALASDRAVHECYARHWLEFTYGRPAAAQDAALIAELGARSLEDGLGVADLIVALVTSPAFLNRSAQELP